MEHIFTVTNTNTIGINEPEGPNFSSCATLTSKLQQDGKEERPIRTVFLWFIKLSMVIQWPEVAVGGGSEVEKFWSIWSQLGLYHRLLTAMSAFCGGTWFGIVSGDKGDRLEEVDWPVVVWSAERRSRRWLNAAIALLRRWSFRQFSRDVLLLWQISIGICFWYWRESTRSGSMTGGYLGWPYGGPKTDLLLLFFVAMLFWQATSRSFSSDVGLGG